MTDKLEELAEHLFDKGFFLEEVVEILEKKLIERALDATKGNQCAAAKMLGIHRNTLQRKLSEYCLDAKRPKRMPPVSVNGTHADAASAAKRKTS